MTTLQEDETLTNTRVSVLFCSRLKLTQKEWKYGGRFVPTSKKGAKYVYKIYINMLDVGQILQKRIPYYLYIF